MTSRINISREEKFLIEIIFKNKSNKNYNFDDIDYDKLIKVASSHLMLPAFYVKLRDKNLLQEIPLDLKKYLKNIYEINKNRNIKLLEEAYFISEIFKKNKIRYVFLKGASLLLGNYFDDYGERMIGDIDILVDFDSKALAIELMNKFNYKSSFNYIMWNTNVEPNFINKKKLFGIDLHNRLMPIKYDSLINSKNALKHSINLDKDIKILNVNDEYFYTIYNYSISDHGFLKASYSYRKLYDLERIKIKSKNILSKNDKYVSFYNYTCFILGINDKKNTEQMKKNKFIGKRISYKIQSKTFFKIDNTICSLIIFFKDIHNKLIEFLANSDYRKHTFKKISKSFF